MSTYLRDLFTIIKILWLITKPYDALCFLGFATAIARSNELSVYVHNYVLCVHKPMASFIVLGHIEYGTGSAPLIPGHPNLTKVKPRLSPSIRLLAISCCKL